MLQLGGKGSWFAGPFFVSAIDGKLPEVCNLCVSCFGNGYSDVSWQQTGGCNRRRSTAQEYNATIATTCLLPTDVSWQQTGGCNRRIIFLGSGTATIATTCLLPTDVRISVPEATDAQVTNFWKFAVDRGYKKRSSEPRTLPTKL